MRIRGFVGIMYYMKEFSCPQPRLLFWRYLSRFIIGITFIILIYGVILAHKVYSSIYRQSKIQIHNSLSGTESQCKKISDCIILPGDILIRRYITQRTWLIDKLANPYFTHSAFYLGNDRLVEAVGTEKNKTDDIQISNLPKSDWQDDDIEGFIIIRLSYTSLELDSIKRNLVDIANDPNYIFGLPKKGFKRAMCADLIFNQLVTHNIVSKDNMLDIITPDYLFSLAIKNKTYFKIIGYNISQ